MDTEIFVEIIRGFEYVLKREKISSTYKYALLTSIMDYIIENPAELPKNGFHYIPVLYLAKRFLYYYFPTTFPNIIEQSGTRLAIQKEITNRLGDIFPKQMESIIGIRDMIESGEELPEKLVRTLIMIRSTILKQPLRYIKVTSNEEKNVILGKRTRIREQKFTIFGLENTKIERPFSYEEARSDSRWIGSRYQQTFNEMIASEYCYISMGAYTFRELTKYRFFLRDAIIKKWIEATRNYLKNDTQLYSKLNRFIEGFSVIDRNPERNSAFITKFRMTMFRHFQQKIRCIYCEKELELEKTEIDHVIPWSKLPINKFWNLAPSCKTCNLTKHDKIVEFDQDLRVKIQNLIQNWVALFIRDERIRRDFASMEDSEFLKKHDPDIISRIYTERIQEIIETLS